MTKYLAKLDWNNMLRNKTATECWNILKYEIESIIYKCFVEKNKENSLERNTCQKKLLEKYRTSKLCAGFIGIPERTERMKTTQSIKRHLMQL